MNPAPLTLGVAPAEAKVLLVFVHGRTQSPEDMVEALIGRLDLSKVHVVLPRADGNSWYDAKAVDPLTDDTRDQLGRALDQLDSDIGAARAAGAPARTIVGGFSQGACLTLEWALRQGIWDGSLVLLTGCRIGTPSDDRPQESLRDLPVYATNGDADPWIPLSAFAEAAQALGAAGARLRADVFPGRPHEIAPPEIGMVSRMIDAALTGADPFQSCGAR